MRPNAGERPLRELAPHRRGRLAQGGQPPSAPAAAAGAGRGGAKRGRHTGWAPGRQGSRGDPWFGIWIWGGRRKSGRGSARCECRRRGGSLVGRGGRRRSGNVVPYAGAAVRMRWDAHAADRGAAGPGTALRSVDTHAIRAHGSAAANAKADDEDPSGLMSSTKRERTCEYRMAV